MSDPDENEKFLDPSQNPMILVVPEPEIKKEETGGDDFAAPMIDLTVSPESITKRLSEAFPGQNEIQIGDRVAVRMADEGYTINGHRLSELPLGDLMAIGEFIADRQKG